MNRIRSIPLALFLLAGVVMIVVSGCDSEQDKIDNYRDRVGPAYEDARGAQDAFNNSLIQNINIDSAITSAVDSLEVVSARASKFQGSARILISVLRSKKPPDRCAIYNSILVDLMEAYSSSVDLVIEELDALSDGVIGSPEDSELEAIRLEEEINLLVSQIPNAEIACFDIE